MVTSEVSGGPDNFPGDSKKIRQLIRLLLREPRLRICVLVFDFEVEKHPDKFPHTVENTSVLGGRTVMLGPALVGVICSAAHHCLQ